MRSFSVHVFLHISRQICLRKSFKDRNNSYYWETIWKLKRSYRNLSIHLLGNLHCHFYHNSNDCSYSLNLQLYQQHLFKLHKILKRRTFKMISHLSIFVFHSFLFHQNSHHRAIWCFKYKIFKSIICCSDCNLIFKFDHSFI
mgnify:CR=1 FL=1